MSLYCSGEGIHCSNMGFIRYEVNCDKKEQCERYKAFREYKESVDMSQTGMGAGLWLVNVSECAEHNYCDGVFIK